MYGGGVFPAMYHKVLYGILHPALHQKFDLPGVEAAGRQRPGHLVAQSHLFHAAVSERTLADLLHADGLIPQAVLVAPAEGSFRCP